jgi:hypothetical protein
VLFPLAYLYLNRFRVEGRLCVEKQNSVAIFSEAYQFRSSAFVQRSQNAEFGVATAMIASSYADYSYSCYSRFGLVEGRPSVCEPAIILRIHACAGLC